ncbi:Hypothetical_protein [Hexamita inflata]|uniref:Hypothetical_protein n=1 Tax=Hexamita inflata TaxID=28002 RepID=A0AA86R278_9EUKA|nr:Hypothetical protein HINF_LOCUS55452 [Hexamita inflata]
MYITAGIALFCILLLLITFKCFNKEKIVQNKPSIPTPKQRSNANSQQKELILNNENQSYSKDTKPTPNQSQKVNRAEPKLKEIKPKVILLEPIQTLQDVKMPQVVNKTSIFSSQINNEERNSIINQKMAEQRQKRLSMRPLGSDVI